ncbi:hypothetical protein [Streptomyces sp. WM6368]|uniref:hypothetical protein n=1 Tax=Streptomyces sp. WM6368 TaxID=1415554 RepID=UPI00131E7EE0|nr:hypothetical protein [Streptomyces sp. WM6368]
MTPLTPTAAQALDDFAADYPSFIRSWAELIAAHLARADRFGPGRVGCPLSAGPHPC